MNAPTRAADFAPYQMASATLLSQQPITLPEQLPKPSDNWDSLFFHLESRLASLRNWRWSWWSYWSVLAQYFLPRRYRWLVTANTMNRGNAINDNIIDGTGTLAMQVCAAGLWSGLTSPSRPWFNLGVELPWVELDADGEVWIEDTEKRIYAVLAQSNFYSTMAQAFQDIVVFGTAPVIIYEHSERVIHFFLPCAGEYYLAVGGDLKVTDLYREFTYTVKQLVDFFTLENCPPEVRNQWQTGGASLDYEYVVCHAIEPNFALDTRGVTGAKRVKVVPQVFSYREVYWLKGRRTPLPLSKAGFAEKPFMCGRWSTVSNDAYGRSPCMDALGDVKQIQMETKEKAEFIKKLTKPPMIADVAMKGEPSSIIPGNITYVNTQDGKKGFMPAFEMHPQALAPMVADIAAVSARVERCLFVDVFMAITRMQGVQPRNELELVKRDQERLQQLGPFIDLFQTEFAGPAVMRVMNILERRGLLMKRPQSIQVGGIKLKYQSLTEVAQRAAQALAIKDFLATAGETSAAAKAGGVPDPLRTVNLDKLLAKYGEFVTLPEDCFYSAEQVKEHDQIRAQAQQQSAAPGEALAGVNAAKTLSETNIEPGNALSALLGNPVQGVG